MKDKQLPIDHSRHVLYTENAKKCVQKLLHRYYDDKTAEDLWEKIQLKYAEFLKDEPALGGVKMTVSIYDPILIFAWYAVVPDKPPLEEVQQDVYDCFMSGFDKQGTCVTSGCCDYCIVGDKNPLAAEVELVKNEDGLLISVKKGNTE